MKAKHLFLTIAVLLAATGLWFAQSAWRAQALEEPSVDASSKTQNGQTLSPTNIPGDLRPASGPEAGGENSKLLSPKPAQSLASPTPLAPPIPNRRFTDFTPEQRVQFARQGHGPGG